MADLIINLDLDTVTQIVKDHIKEKHNLSLDEYTVEIRWDFVKRKIGVANQYSHDTPVKLEVMKKRR